MRRASVNQYFSVVVNQKIIIYHTTFNKPIMMPLFSAFRLGANLESIKRILQDINDINYGNFNALNEAIRCNCDLEIMEELLYKGININKRDWYGMTPLHFAVTSKKGSLYVPKLLALGADVNAINIVGETPLYLAVYHSKKSKFVKMLLEYGADTEHEYFDLISGSITILYIAVRLEAASIAKILIKTMFLKNFVNNYSKVIKLKCDPTINCGDLSIFIVKCIGELGLMQTTKINSFYSVFNFAQLGNNCYTKPLYNIDFTYSELNTMFPIYSDVIKQNIALALERGEWINQFKDLQKCKISSGHDSEGREVILNFDCVEKICSYLSNQELQAFSKAFHM